jgi:hypothetical protein
MSWLSRWWNKRPASHYKPEKTRPQVETLEDRAVPTVQYYGGGVLASVKAQAVYYGSGAASLQTNFDTYVNYIVKSPYMDALNTAGYNVGEGSAVAGYADNVPNLNTGTTITDQSIESRLQTDIKNGVVQNPDGNNFYIIVVEPNVAVSIQGSNSIRNFLGYHNAFNGTDFNGSAQTIHYAVITYPGGTIGNAALPSYLAPTAFDQLTSVTSHELAEAVTDPNVGLNNRIGWYDFSRNGEIGDITENNSNAYVRLNNYLVQEVANKNDSLLVINTSSTPTPPAPTPGSTATKTTLTSSILRPLGRRQSAVVLLTIDVATLPPGSVSPNGTVELIYAGSVIATAQVSSVGGVSEVSFEAFISRHGSYTFTAAYLGNSSFQSSTSGSVTVTV